MASTPHRTMSHKVAIADPRCLRRAGIGPARKRRRLAYNAHTGGANRRGHCQTCPRRATLIAIPAVLCSSEIADRTARRDHLCGGNDGIGVYAIISVQLLD